jgi:hypothetical protein
MKVFKRLAVILGIISLNALLVLATLWQGGVATVEAFSPVTAAFLNSQAESGGCRYINPDGTVSGEVFLTLDACAKAVYDETIRLGLPEGYGLYDKFALRVTRNGEVYAAPTDNVTRGAQLDWQYLGNLSGAAPTGGQPVPAPQNPPRNEPAAPASNVGTAGGGRDEVVGTVPATLDQIFDVAAEDINDFWRETFKDYGYEYTEPRIVIFDRSQVRSGCGVAPAQVGPFYCNVDHTMYYPVWFMEQQWRQYGDYAVVTIIAHEWGHSIQNLLGVLQSGDYTINIELQADCFAGAYTQYANESSTKIRLDASDLQEGAIALFNAADPDGTPWWDSQAHGTGDQRAQAFEDGFKFGVSDC